MPHKEEYRINLPHFQQPGQAYFITWCLKGAIPKHALKRYSDELKMLKLQIAGEAAGEADSDPLIKEANRNWLHPNWLHPHPLLQKYYAVRRKYIKAFNDLLDADKNPKINLNKPENLIVVVDALKFWEGKKLTNHAFCVMPNHVHWVVELLKIDQQGKPVYLEDILYSVKRFSATEINKHENRSGKMWQKESFDTTIRDEKHMYNAIEYTRNNPVNAGFVKDWKDWSGSWCAG